MAEIVIVGGGVIGLSIALELSRAGAAVAVLEQGEFGREASWAGAGILPPGNLAGAHTAEARLRSLSHALWPDWAQSVSSDSGIDTGYLRCGGLEVLPGSEDSAIADDELTSAIESWQAEGILVEEVPPGALRELEPAVSSEMARVYRLPEMGQVRNPRLVKALVAACKARGVQLHPGTPAVSFQQRNDSITSVRTPHGTVQGRRFCIAGGPWSRTILSTVGVDLPVEPVRGQIVLLSHVPRLFSHVIQVGRRYLVPRDDGRVLIGSTEEHAGFQKANTAQAVSELIHFGTQVVPALAQARFETAWSGLRPGSPGGLPFLGRVGSYENLLIATGHFRSGLQMSPGTARLMRQALLSEPTDIPLEPYALDQPRDPAAPFLNLPANTAVGL